MTDNKILKNINKILQKYNNEKTDFPTKNCRSAKKIIELTQVFKSNATFVVEMYIYRTKKVLCEAVQKIL